MLHFDFNTFDTSVARHKLYFDNDSVLREYSSDLRSIYKENTLFVASPLVHILTTHNAIFTVNSLYYFDNTKEFFHEVYIDFDDGFGYRLVGLNEAITIHYLEDGIKIIKFKVSLNNGNVLMAYATMTINTESQIVRSTHIHILMILSGLMPLRL